MKKTKLVLRRETIKALTVSKLRGVAGGLRTYTQTDACYPDHDDQGNVCEYSVMATRNPSCGC